MPDHQHWMQLALDQAKIAATLGEVPVGAVIVQNDKCIAQAHNHPIALHDPSAHAEIQALRQAAKHMSNYRLNGASLYITLEPCMMCLGALIHARVEYIIYGAG